MIAHDPAGSYDEAVCIYAALLVLAPVPSRHGYVQPAVQSLRYALNARGYTVVGGVKNPTLVPWPTEDK